MIVLSNYQLEQCIYESENSVVYRGVRTTDNLPVIGKMLAAEYPSAEQNARFKREYELVSLFDGNGCIRVYDLLTYQHRQAMIIEDFGGVSLAQLKHQGTHFSLLETLSLGVEVADTLSVVHRKKVIHKDVAPGNILYNPHSREVRLIDFGIASTHTQQAATFQSLSVLEGTLPYIAPEQTGRMNRRVDFRADLYSLGVVLYELLTGRLPFESTDLLELVHCHLAVPPVPPTTINPDIPSLVSDLILKLLSKSADDRYQTAAGLAFDLRHCVTALEAGGPIPEFTLGWHDTALHFALPQRLYGRETETRLLLEAFDRMKTGQTELLLVSGYSGIGKSVLVQELYKPVTERHGYFLAGKFDQFQRNTPYAAFLQAFQAGLVQILTESEATIEHWRTRLLTALGNNGSVLAAVLPEVELILGKQPPAVSLSPTEAQNRFLATFLNFLAVWAHPDHPLVLFLDDLQWADSDSLKLLQMLFTVNPIPNLLMISAFRANEVSTVHPLTLVLEEIHKSDTTVTELQLRALDQDTVTRFVADALHSDPSVVGGLAELIYKKTAGNPFFTGEFLKSLTQNDLIGFDDRLGRWTWDLEQITQTQITDNVADLLCGKLKKLAPSTQEIVTVAACLGSQFSFHHLCLVTQKSPQLVLADVRDAISEELLSPIGDGYRLLEFSAGDTQLDATFECCFVHDRIQQAAHSLLDETQKTALHLVIGRRLEHGLSVSEREQEQFTIVNHLNLGGSLLTNEVERTDLARKNLAAGRKAKASAAFQPAADYFETGLRFLPASAWETCYELTLALHEEAAETALWCAQTERADELIAIVLANVRRFTDSIRVRDAQIQSLISKNRLQECIACSLEALNQLGLVIPPVPTEADVQRVFVEVQQLLAGRAPHELLDLPEMTEPWALAAMQMLMRGASAALQTNLNLAGLFTLHRVRLSLKYGNSGSSVTGYIAFAQILATRLKQIQAAEAFGRLALDLVEKLQATQFRTRTLLLYNLYIRMYWRPFRESFQPFTETFLSGFESGDFEFATFALISISMGKIYIGEPLGQLEEELARYLEMSRKYRQSRAHQVFLLQRQYVRNLTGQTVDPCSLSLESETEESLLAHFTARRDGSFLGAIYYLKLLLLFLFGHTQAVLKICETTRGYMLLTYANLSGVTLFWCGALAQLRLYDPHSTTAESDWTRIETYTKELEVIRSTCPEMVHSKFHLVRAETHRVKGNLSSAMFEYEQAISQARTHQLLLDEAIACEYTAAFYATIDQRRIARAYLEDAWSAYSRLGATAKLRHLQETFADIPIQVTERRMSGSSLTTTQATMISTSSRRSTGVLDVHTLLRAAQVLSGELKLERLLAKMIRLAMENAGAQRAVLLLPRDGQWFIAAQCSGQTITVLESIAFTDIRDWSEAAVNLATRTREIVLSDNAAQDRRFVTDAYIQRVKPASLLCLPVQNQGKLSAILYLENQTVAGAFTAERVEVMNMLSAQAAMSIENALLYANLEEKVRERTLELSQTVEQLQQSEAEIKAKNTQILDSIRYAETIQQAILKADEPVVGTVGEYFILFKPRDIVSGDFYWFQDFAEGVLVGIADCTGHGVPGALMSMIGTTLLNQIVVEKGITEPGRILELLHEGIRRALRQGEAGTETQDGMDIALCQINVTRRRLIFAGAKRPLYVVWNDGNFEEIPGNRKPIGGQQREEIRRYQSQELELQSGMMLYMCSDGFTDQPNLERQKYGTKRLRTLLQTVARIPVEIQHQHIEQALAAHQGSELQRDDITVFGLKISL